MTTIETLKVLPRTEIGSTASRRLRCEGIVPGSVYGHKQGAVSVQVQGDEMRAVVQSGTKVLDLDMDNQMEKVLVKDVQWDTFSKHILHVDFQRVDPNERVTVEVPIHLRGTAPGALKGGILEQPMHALEVECLAVDIPEFIQVRIGHLEIGQSLHVSELTELPAGITVTSSPESVVVNISQEGPEVEPEDATSGPAVPERIGEEAESDEED